MFYTDPTTQKPTFKNFYPGSISANDIVAQVIDGPDVVFEINADATFTVSHLFANYKTNATTGDTLSGQSRVSLDVATADSSSTFQLKAVDISQDPSNSDISAASGVDVLVIINEHSYKSGTVGQS